MTKNSTRDWQHHTYVAFRKPLKELSTDKYGQKNYKGTGAYKKGDRHFKEERSMYLLIVDAVLRARARLAEKWSMRGRRFNRDGNSSSFLRK